MKDSATIKFIEKAKLIHGSLYDYSKVKYIKNQQKIIIICKLHGEFKQTPYNHIKKTHGCHKCGRKISADKQKKSSEDFIKEAINVHKNKYDYKLINYINNRIKIDILCKIHGKFKQTPKDHLKGRGCSKCVGKNQTTNDFINKANLAHCNFYIYNKVIYKNSTTKVIITCPNHGDFKQTPNSHLNNHGCPMCSKNKKLDTEEFIKKANVVHNYKYNYNKVNCINSTTKVIITCPNHGDFEQTPNSHINGKSGCLSCAHIISKPEIEWLNYLNVPEQYRQKKIKINNKIYSVDAYDPNQNIIYEFYGDFWHGNPKIYKNSDMNLVNKKTFGYLYIKTKKREKELAKYGFTVIFIWENDWKNIK